MDLLGPKDRARTENNPAYNPASIKSSPKNMLRPLALLENINPNSKGYKSFFSYLYKI